jgi:hypothetical protein
VGYAVRHRLAPATPESSSASNDLVSPIWRDETATVRQKSTNPLEKVNFWRFGLVNRFSQPVSGRARNQGAGRRASGPQKAPWWGYPVDVLGAILWAFIAKSRQNLQKLTFN